MFGSPLQRAISRGLRPGGSLCDELRQLEKRPLRTRRDARAICKALAVVCGRAHPDNGNDIRDIRELAYLFKQVPTPKEAAAAVLRAEGIPQLANFFQDHAREKAGDDCDLSFIFPVLSMYGTRAGADIVIMAARMGYQPSSLSWETALSWYAVHNPQRMYIFRELGNPLPTDLIAIALLDAGNEAALEHGLEQHPFDTATGHRKLHEWLADRDAGKSSYAVSAAAAIPFISKPERDRLLALALDHSVTHVQLEAAWAAAKLGRRAGVDLLARYCLDVHHAEMAKRYMNELQIEELIPEEALEPSFEAKATFAQWLAHPSELGRPPDKLEIVDHRELAWPPDREKRPFWLIRYEARDDEAPSGVDVDCGLVGSVTFCLFSYQIGQRPPEDAYGIHCYFEMHYAKLITELESPDAGEYARLIDQWSGEALSAVKLKRIAEMAPDLEYPQRLVGIATARMKGEKGWVVFDGARSTWYPRSEMPDKTRAAVVLMLHVGRHLLRFEEQPDRKRYLKQG